MRQHLDNGSNDDMTTITATYSPEDNKLRLYASARLDADTYTRVKAAGFGWAPKQQLFVAPAWTPGREDLCIALAGDVEAEGTTVAERAEAKAARLQGIAARREGQASAYQRAAQAIGERFAGGQPILVGHHSERKARKDQERMHAAAGAAAKAADAVNYWHYRAAGVIATANYKNDPRTTERRIKTLLAELRDHQRKLNHAHLCLTTWSGIEALRETDPARFADMVYRFAGARYQEGGTCSWETWRRLDRKEITAEEALADGITCAETVLASPQLARWIQHTLNRLAYERSQLGDVARFEGEITPAVLQIFCREQGTDKPVATAAGDVWTVKAGAALPAHLGEGAAVTLTADGWRDLMQQCGHLPKVASDQPKSLKQSLPLLNFRLEGLLARNMYRKTEQVCYPQVEMTKAEYAAIGEDFRATCVSWCGRFKFRVAHRRGQRLAVYLTDSKAHPIPEGLELPAQAEEVAA